MSDRKRRFLFICHAAMNRSPTAEDVCRQIARANHLDIDASSAGISRGAERPVTKEMADTADKIFVMEPEMEAILKKEFGQESDKIICLDIPDIYATGDAILVKTLEDALYEFLTREGLL